MTEMWEKNAHDRFNGAKYVVFCLFVFYARPVKKSGSYFTINLQKEK